MSVREFVEAVGAANGPITLSESQAETVAGAIAHLAETVRDKEATADELRAKVAELEQLLHRRPLEVVGAARRLLKEVDFQLSERGVGSYAMTAALGLRLKDLHAAVEGEP